MSTDTRLFFDSPLQTWASQDDCRNDFNARLASQTALPTDTLRRLDVDQIASLQLFPRKSSTVLHPLSECDLDSMASDSVPALTRGNSIASTSSTSSSDIASVIDGGCVLTTEDGILTLPPRYFPDSNLLCPFQVLECREAFSSIVDFKTHVFSHFRGHPLPDYAPCFVCNQPFFLRYDDDTALIWNQLLDHMVHEHYRGEEEGFILRPALAVLRYMWNKSIISDAELTRAQFFSTEIRVATLDINRNGFAQIYEVPMAPSAPVPSEVREHLRQNQSAGLSSGPYTVTAGRRHERRNADRLRIMARVRGNL